MTSTQTEDQTIHKIRLSRKHSTLYIVVFPILAVEFRWEAALLDQLVPLLDPEVRAEVLNMNVNFAVVQTRIQQNRR